MEYYSAIKKNEILPFAKTWMDLDGTMLSEVSQKEKNKLRKWFNKDIVKKIFCLHPKFKLRVVCKILRMLFVHIYQYS